MSSLNQPRPKSDHRRGWVGRWPEVAATSFSGDLARKSQKKNPNLPKITFLSRISTQKCKQDHTTGWNGSESESLPEVKLFSFLLLITFRTAYALCAWSCVVLFSDCAFVLVFHCVLYLCYVLFSEFIKCVFRLWCFFTKYP